MMADGGAYFFGVTLTFKVVWRLAKNCLGIIFALKRPLFTTITCPNCVDQLQFFFYRKKTAVDQRTKPQKKTAVDH